MDSKKWQKILNNCPGVYLGHKPTPFYSGCIIIDVGQVQEALRYLWRQTIPISETKDAIIISIPFSEEE